MSTAESRTQTHWIHLPQGRLFAQSWSPAQPGASAALAPLVLLHDSLGCVAMWRDLPAQLAQATGRTVYAYDRLGYGQSDAVSEPPGLGFVAAEAEHSFPSVREQLGLERYALLGHSVGSGMALEIAARAGDACEAVVTIAGQAFVEEHTRSGIRVAREQFQNPEHLARLAKYHGDKARWVVDAWTETWLSPAFAHWSVQAALPHIHCPVLTMHGELDEYGTPEHPQRIASGVRGPAQAVIIPGAHHMPHREMPALVIQQVATFLAPLAA